MKTTPSTFADFNFSPEITKAITELGYETPTQIQIEALPILMKETTDFIGLASTGTGKTAAFAIPLLEKMDASKKGVQGLILCPTRELAKQVTEQINLLARHKKTKALAIYGGADYGGQLRALKEGVSIVVGTPGRIIDHLERKTLNLNHLETVILDEADEMISMGFKEEIEFILQTVQQDEKHQTWLFSATMSREIRKIADQFLTKPKQVQVNKSDVLTSSVTQYFYQVHENDKPQAVEKLIDSVDGFYGIIFCQTKANVTELTQHLKSNGYAVDCLHGDMEQNARERTMKAFKARQVSVIVCTDVASRGIDVKDLTHVMNYSLPRELDLYVHRIGRTGRGGKEGIALNLVNSTHMHLVGRIEKMTRTKMIKAQLPNESTLMKLKVARTLGDFNKPEGEATPVLGNIKGLLLETGWKEVIDLMSKEEIVARFLSKQIKVSKAKTAVGSDRGFEGRDERRGGGRGGRAFGERGGRFGRGGGRRDFGRDRDGGGRSEGGGKERKGNYPPRAKEPRPTPSAKAGAKNTGSPWRA